MEVQEEQMIEEEKYNQPLTQDEMIQSAVNQVIEEQEKQTNKTLSIIGMVFAIIGFVSMAFLCLSEVGVAILMLVTGITKSEPEASFIFFIMIAIFILVFIASLVGMIWAINITRGKYPPTIGKGVFMCFFNGIIDGIIFIILAVKDGKLQNNTDK